MMKFIAFLLMATTTFAQIQDSTSALAEKANAGDARAQAVLGWCYRKGFKVPADEEKALLFVRKSVNQDNALGLYVLGRWTEDGICGISKNPDGAQELYRRSLKAGLVALASSGDPWAQSFLSALYLTGGGGITANLRDGVEWCRKAADQGLAPAQCVIGFVFATGELGPAKDEAEAIKWYRKAADQGFAPARELLAKLIPIEFDFDAVKAKGDTLKGNTLVFKGFYLGMPIADAQGLINHYMGLKQVLATPIEDNSAMSKAKQSKSPQAAAASAMLQAYGDAVKGMTPQQLKQMGLDDDSIAALGITDPSASYRIYSRGDQLFVSKAEQSKPFAVANASGKVTQFELSSEMIRKFFGSMPAEEFLQSFVNAYSLPGFDTDRQKITVTLMGQSKDIGIQNIFRHRDAKGYEVIYYSDSLIYDDDLKSFADTPPEGTMTIQEIETADVRESKFD